MNDTKVPDTAPEHFFEGKVLWAKVSPGLPDEAENARIRAELSERFGIAINPPDGQWCWELMQDSDGKLVPNRVWIETRR